MARRTPPPKARRGRPAPAKAPRARVVPRVVVEEYDARARQLPTGDREDDAAPATGQEDLGPIVLPTPDDSRRVLAELARLYHERFDAMQRHDALHTAAKAAGAEVQAINERIAARIRSATHRTGLPLFTAMEHDDAED